jgi:hypothetical protein
VGEPIGALHGEHAVANAADRAGNYQRLNALKLSCRRLTAADLPWIKRLFELRYPPDWDWITTEGWLTARVLPNPGVYFPVRSPNAFLIGMVEQLPWTPSRFEFHIQAICADEDSVWEAAQLLRAGLEWAKQRGCWRCIQQSDMYVTPLMLRVGAHAVPHYEVLL